MPAPAVIPPADAAVRPPAVVGLCTADHALLATLRDAAPDVVVVAVETPQALADAIVARDCFAAFLDVRTLCGSLSVRVPALVRQFPTLPIVAIGTRAEEAEVARLIGSGEVYRFLHLPVSLERARTFVGAAQRRADDLRQRRAAARAAAGDDGEDDPDDRDDDGPRRPAAAAARRLPSATRAPVAAASDPARSATPPSNARAGLFAFTALGLAVAAGTTWWSRPEPLPLAAPAADRIVADLVGAAGAAVAADELLAPAGRSAAEYYAQALARRPADTEARAALLALADRMLGAGERALAGGRWQEAELAAVTVALVRARDPRVLALRTRADAARAAAESTPLVGEPAAPPVPLVPPLPPVPRPSDNTDERAAFEDARDVPVVTVADTATGSALAARPTDAIATAPVAPPVGLPTPPPVGVPTASPVGVPTTPPDSPPDSPPDTAPGDAPASPPPGAPLRRIESAPAVYPPTARSLGIEGWVDVAFTVDARGQVVDARVLAAQPVGTFDAAALDAVRRWRYAPVPAPQAANLRLRFQLER